MEKISTPFSKEQCKNLNISQMSGNFHPFTCCGPGEIKECKRNDSYNRRNKGEEVPFTDENEGVLKATSNGWICPCGKYTQNWAHGFMSESAVEKEFTFDGVIFDYPGRDKWSHLVAENVELLHEAAKRLGLKPTWFQPKPNRPHYDLRGGKIARAKALGIKQVSEKDLVRFMQKHYPIVKSTESEED